MRHPIALALVALVALPLIFAQALAAEDEAYAPQKVVYHVNFSGGEANKLYYATLRNVQNHVNAVGKDRLDLRVVMNGDGLGMLMEAKEDRDLSQRVANLKSQGVRFQVCKNTLTGRDISLDDLYDVWEDDIVPSGVAEVGKLQQEGFSYVKTY